MNTFWKKTGFVQKTLEYIDQRNDKCIFLLLGNFAKSLASFIPNAVKNGHIVEGVHPSPLSAHGGFFGSNIFREVEMRLGEEIDWTVDK
jgi:uracil-DNA glycosylase